VLAAIRFQPMDGARDGARHPSHLRVAAGGAVRVHATITSISHARWGWIKNRNQHCQQDATARSLETRPGRAGVRRLRRSGNLLRRRTNPIGRLNRRVQGRCAQRKALGPMAEARLGREARHYLKLGETSSASSAPMSVCWSRGPRTLPRPGPQGGPTLYAGLRRSVCPARRPDREKAAAAFLPGTTAFSLAAAGCGFRCLNCQNWDISHASRKRPKTPAARPCA